MKKIYMIVAGLILGGSIIGQNVLTSPVMQRHKGTMAPNSKPIPVNHSTGASRVAFGTWVEPIGDVMRSKQIDLNGSTSVASQDIFVDIVYQDSTVTLSDASGTYTVGDQMIGSVLDPKSSLIDSATGTGLVTYADQYYLDSIAIIGSYVKVTSAVDTLYTYIVWGDTTATTGGPAFAKGATSFFWVSPISTWRPEVIGPKVHGAAAGPGNLIKPNADASHMVLVKYVLTDNDSVSSGGHLKFIYIPLPHCITIPPGNIVSCFYTFVPGGAYLTGDCSYSFTGGAPQTVNGFAGEVWQQTNPVLTAVTDYQDHQLDYDGWNMGVDYTKNQRHKKYNNATYEGIVKGDLVTGPRVFYFISDQPTGVNELSNNNSTLLQNQPNPFTNQTSVKYQLKKAASDVAVQIYDVRGVKVFEKVEKNLKAGNYSVEITDNTLASGMYFCTLTVDGEKVTNKMIKK